MQLQLQAIITCKVKESANKWRIPYLLLILRPKKKSMKSYEKNASEIQIQPVKAAL